MPGRLEDRTTSRCRILTDVDLYRPEFIETWICYASRSLATPGSKGRLKFVPLENF
jgi:hypothetical protein